MYSGINARACANDFVTNAVSLSTDKKRNHTKKVEDFKVDEQPRNIFTTLSLF